MFGYIESLIGAAPLELDRSREEQPATCSGVRGGLIQFAPHSTVTHLYRPGLIQPCARRCDVGHGAGAQRQVTRSTLSRRQTAAGIVGGIARWQGGGPITRQVV